MSLVRDSPAQVCAAWRGAIQASAAKSRRTHLKNEKTPPASQRYDRNAAILPQMWMPVRQTSSNRYDASLGNMTPIKSVTLSHVNRSRFTLPYPARATRRTSNSK
jgi:hypothetical protein